jgi:hypothetical protein
MHLLAINETISVPYFPRFHVEFGSRFSHIAAPCDTIHDICLARHFRKRRAVFQKAARGD